MATRISVSPDKKTVRVTMSAHIAQIVLSGAKTHVRELAEASAEPFLKAVLQEVASDLAKGYVSLLSEVPALLPVLTPSEEQKIDAFVASRNGVGSELPAEEVTPAELPAEGVTPAELPAEEVALAGETSLEASNRIANKATGKGGKVDTRA